MELKVHVRLKLSGGLDTNAIIFRSSWSKPQCGFSDRLLDGITDILSEGISLPLLNRAELFHEIPPCINNHVFIVFPMKNKDDGSYSQMVCGIQVADDSMLTRNEVLRRFHDEFPQCDSISSGTKLEVHLVFKQECPAIASQNAYDAFGEIEESRRFGCGTLFLATDSEDDSLSSSPYFQQSPTFSPNLSPTIPTNDNCWFQDAVSQAPSTPTNAWPPDAACAARDGHVAVVPMQLSLHEPRDLKVHQKTAGDTGFQRYATDTPSDAIKCVQYLIDTPTSHNRPLIRDEEGANGPVKEVPLDSTDGQMVPTVEESLPSTSSYNSGSSTDGEPAPALKNSQDVMCNGNFLTVTTGMVTGVDLRLSASACTTASPCHPRNDNSHRTPPDNSHRAPPDNSHRAPPDNSHRAPPDNSHRVPPDNSPITAPDNLPQIVQGTVPGNLPRTAPDNSPKPTTDISPKSVPGHVPSVIPIERQVSSEGEAVLNDTRPFVHQQQILGLQLPKIAVQDTTHSTVGGKNSDEEEEVYTVPDEHSELQTTSQEPASSQESDDDLLHVHALEHACNGEGAHCRLEDLCPKMWDAVRIQEMVAAVELLRAGGSPTENMKRYIRKHCRHCTDTHCKVPHLAAGCPAPGATPLPTPTPTPTPTPSAMSSHPVGLVDISVDPIALNSDGERSSWCQNQPYIGLDLCDARSNAVADTQAVQHPPRVGLPPYYAPTGLTTHLPSPAFHGHRDLLCPPIPRSSLHPFGRRFIGHHISRPVTDMTTTNGVGHQATDMNHQHPNERRQYSYLQHNHEAHAVIRRSQQPSRELPDVTAVGFPAHATYFRGHPGTIIYAAEEMRSQLIPGTSVPPPNMEKGTFLGRGGNGRIVKHTVYGQEFAVKLTLYRPSELNLWSKFNHPNIVRLSAVLLSDKYNKCFQLMPRMTNDLSSILKAGTIMNLSAVHQDVDSNTWRDVVLPNVIHILTGILKGLEYLHNLNIQHRDVKASNVLILQRCQCEDVIKCKCPVEGKCGVQLADFDSAVQRDNAGAQDRANHPEVVCVEKSPKEMARIMGTPGNRAPEQIQCPPPVVAAHIPCLNSEGPWCDIWSFGMLVLRMFLGPNRPEDIRNACLLRVHPYRSKMDPQIEPIHAHVKLMELLSSDHYQLQCVGHFVKSCLCVDYRKRPTTKHLLERLSHFS